MMILDEAHLICNLKSAITKSIIRMQPKYRYALTATPIPNYVYNIFSLMGWLCVPGWYKGNKENLRWPFTKENVSQFTRQFMAREADITAAFKEKIAPIYKPSPLIGMPTKLLKLLCPNMAFLSKEQCNPDLVPCEIIETRVPMGEMQHRAYNYWTDVDNIKKKMSHWRKYGVQLQYLRGVCATPKVGKHSDLLLEQTGWQPDSQMTPKMISILEKTFECIAKGEQVVIVYARCEMGTEIERRITEAGLTASRIDSEVLSRYHSRESNKFIRKDTQVMLMGIKCAQAYSFQQCSNLIIASLEWSYGAYNQAVGRVYRLNSPKPVTVYVILTENSIEEAMYDKLGSKEDTAKICMHGERVPKDVVPMSLDEVFADHLGIFGESEGVYVSEYECEDQWPDLIKTFNKNKNREELIAV
jgi:SNF2 family DNA or RNA helicase